ncbi:unnamed protein product [Cylicocyclus nassatus]|uniref:BTB domain-containing protein n=1 Tax=Cylicocyclus nassatus TaxID=53992 RepID=A0AA36DVQ9_CYLNA|nr:unnamed protein product [Cylicocyclus nassatus]
MPVVLNVGGTKFYTSLETLMKNPGLREKSMLAEMNFVEGEEVFIDRDPTHFSYILNYHRDGAVNVNGGGSIRAQIKREAQFYGLENLVQHIEFNLSRGLWRLSRPKFSKILRLIHTSRYPFLEIFIDHNV